MYLRFCHISCFNTYVTESLKSPTEDFYLVCQNECYMDLLDLGKGYRCAPRIKSKICTHFIKFSKHYTLKISSSNLYEVIQVRNYPLPKP